MLRKMNGTTVANTSCWWGCCRVGWFYSFCSNGTFGWLCTISFPTRFRAVPVSLYLLEN
ncbi:hypothetical protein EVA_20743 [gut metagenome]|uniref:Uncharacterized protein n=1 Tax=gut metagenome TaxID=749906 RepID=J9FUX7_9ZZZZ